MSESYDYNAGYATTGATTSDAQLAGAGPAAADPNAAYDPNAYGGGAEAGAYYAEGDPNEGYEMGEYGAGADEYGGYGGAYDPNTYDPNTAGYEEGGAGYDPNAYGGEGGWEGDAQQMYDSQGNPIAYEFGDQAAAAGGQPGETGSDQLGTTGGVTASEKAPLSPEEGGEVIQSVINYEPKSNGWFQDVSSAIILSKAYKLFFGLQLYTVLIGAIVFGVDYLFATLHRCLNPPDSSVDAAGQSIAYFSIFLVLSFFIVTFICTVMDMMEDLWNADRDDKKLWGIGMHNEEPPWVVYVILVLGTLFLPLIWAMSLTVSRNNSILFFAQYFFYISCIIAFWLCVLCFVWFIALAAMEKQKAYKRRHESDDFDKHIGRIQEDKQKWFHSTHVLEEYGLDERSLNWSLATFLITLSPIFLIAAITSMDGTNEPWNGAWIALALIFFSMIVFIQQASISTKRYRGALASIACNVFFGLFGLIGCGVAQNGGLFGVFFVCFLSTHFLFLRKRNHHLTRREIYSLFNIPYHTPELAEDEDEELDEAWEDEVRLFNKSDSYLCFCRNTWMSCLPCFNMAATFGFTHPEVLKEEKRLRKRRMCARTDQKVLFYFWILISFCLIVSLAFERNQYKVFTASVAKRSGAAFATPSGTPHPMCTREFNTAGTAKLKIYDMALLAVLQHSYGQHFDRDFSQWFSHVPTLSRVHPGKMPATETEALKGVHAEWTDYADIQSQYHYVVVRGLSKGPSWMRNLDIWGESMALQMTSALTPFVSIWPKKHKQDFVTGTSFLKYFYGGNNATWGLEGYVNTLVHEGHEVVLIGEGFNGGLADIVGRKHNIPTVIFNAPGTQLLTHRDDLKMNHANSIHVASEGNLYSFIDDVSGEGVMNWIPCSPSAKNANMCGHLEGMLNSVLRSCGDEYGRSL